jgi:hypothetical protein
MGCYMNEYRFDDLLHPIKPFVASADQHVR